MTPTFSYRSTRRFAVRTRFAVMRIAITVAALLALAIETGAASKFK
jgi:hypothetical protein